MKTDIARTFAALNATNEAILYAKSPEGCTLKVCEAAFSVGTSWPWRSSAGAGNQSPALRRRLWRHVPRLRSIDISTVPYARGFGCLRAGLPRPENMRQQRFSERPALAGLARGRQANQVGAAALPLICSGERVGVLLVSRREAHSIDEQLVSMLERVSANISFALDNFDHEAARKNGERTMRRLNRMFGAISATNEAILRAKTEQELYQRVCDAAYTAVNPRPSGPARGAGPTSEPPQARPIVDRSCGRRSDRSGNPYGTGSAAGIPNRQPAVTTISSTLPGHLAPAHGRPASRLRRRSPDQADDSFGVLLFFVGKFVAEDERSSRDGADRGDLSSR